MTWRCWFGHKWKVVKYTNYQMNYIPSFNLFYICKFCKKVKCVEHRKNGYLTNEQFYEIWEETNVER